MFQRRPGKSWCILLGNHQQEKTKYKLGSQRGGFGRVNKGEYNWCHFLSMIWDASQNRMSSSQTNPKNGGQYNIAQRGCVGRVNKSEYNWSFLSMIWIVFQNIWSSSQTNPTTRCSTVLPMEEALEESTEANIIEASSLLFGPHPNLLPGQPCLY